MTNLVKLTQVFHDFLCLPSQNLPPLDSQSPFALSCHLFKTLSFLAKNADHLFELLTFECVHDVYVNTLLFLFLLLICFVVRLIYRAIINEPKMSRGKYFSPFLYTL
jgi:hypothetical protein